jgi:hypothetical protein
VSRPASKYDPYIANGRRSADHSAVAHKIDISIIRMRKHLGYAIRDTKDMIHDPLAD